MTDQPNRDSIGPATTPRPQVAFGAFFHRLPDSPAPRFVSPKALNPLNCIDIPAPARVYSAAVAV
jgi:hypothetical protein